MSNMITVLGALAGIVLGFIAFDTARRIASGGVVQALLITALFIFIAGLMTRWVIPGIIDVVGGFYVDQGKGWMSLLIGMVLFLVTVLMSGAILTAAPGLQPWHRQAAWGLVLFIGFVYGKSLFQAPIQTWWKRVVLPSEQPWAMGLENGSTFFLFVIGVAATLFVARWASNKI